jgi:hypothetical protein
VKLTKNSRLALEVHRQRANIAVILSQPTQIGALWRSLTYSDDPKDCNLMCALSAKWHLMAEALAVVQCC